MWKASMYQTTTVQLKEQAELVPKYGFCSRCLISPLRFKLSRIESILDALDRDNSFANKCSGNSMILPNMYKCRVTLSETSTNIACSGPEFNACDLWIHTSGFRRSEIEVSSYRCITGHFYFSPPPCLAHPWDDCTCATFYSTLRGIFFVSFIQLINCLYKHCEWILWLPLILPPTLSLFFHRASHVVRYSLPGPSYLQRSQLPCKREYSIEGLAQSDGEERQHRLRSTGQRRDRAGPC